MYPTEDKYSNTRVKSVKLIDNIDINVIGAKKELLIGEEINSLLDKSYLPRKVLFPIWCAWQYHTLRCFKA